MTTKRIPIEQLSGAALDAAMRYLLGAVEADRYKGRADCHKKHRLLWAHQSGYVDVPEELIT